MEYNDPFLQISQIYNTLSASNKKLADLVLQNHEFFLQNSISEVAAACEVAEATVSRFCRLLGYKGYHDFKVSIAKYASAEKDSDLNISSGKSASVQSTAQVLLAQNIRALNETASLISPALVNRIIKVLLDAKRILFIGCGSSQVTAQRGFIKFIRITPKASICPESHMQYMAAALLSEGDAAIVISHSGSTKEIVDIAEAMQKKGVSVICITRYRRSPLTQYADFTLTYSSDEHMVYGFSISSAAAQNYLLDLLYVEYFKRSYDTSMKNQEDSAALLLGRMY